MVVWQQGFQRPSGHAASAKHGTLLHEQQQHALRKIAAARLGAASASTLLSYHVCCRGHVAALQRAVLHQPPSRSLLREVFLRVPPLAWNGFVGLQQHRGARAAKLGQMQGVAAGNAGSKGSAARQASRVAKHAPAELRA